MRTLFAAALLVASVPAHAILVVVEPDDYTLGTDLSHVTPGVTLTRLVQPDNLGVFNPSVQPVYASGCGFNCPAFTGSVTFGTFLQGGSYERCFAGASIGTPCRDDFSVLNIEFDTPTNFLELSFTTGVDYPLLLAYDVAGNLIQRCFASFGNPGCATLSSPGGGTRGIAFFNHGTADIARVVVGGDGGNSTIDRLVFERVASVPEPSSLALLSVGLLGMAYRRRARSSKHVAIAKWL